MSTTTSKQQLGYGQEGVDKAEFGTGYGGSSESLKGSTLSNEKVLLGQSQERLLKSQNDVEPMIVTTKSVTTRTEVPLTREFEQTAEMRSQDSIHIKGEAQGDVNLQDTTGMINLKPICIEQEPVTFQPKAITIQQAPVMIQPEPIRIPQPPIVIRPEPIVIPQAPLVFNPPAFSVARPPVVVQPEAITIQRPSYSIQPQIQFDLTGSDRFQHSEHVHIKLTNEEAMMQQNRQYGQSIFSTDVKNLQANIGSQHLAGVSGGNNNTYNTDVQSDSFSRTKSSPIVATGQSNTNVSSTNLSSNQWSNSSSNVTPTNRDSDFRRDNFSSDRKLDTNSYGTSRDINTSSTYQGSNNLNQSQGYNRDYVSPKGMTQNTQSAQNTNLNGSTGAMDSTGSGKKKDKAKFFSRDRNYNHGRRPSIGDKLKDAFGVKNVGAAPIQSADPTVDAYATSNKH